MRTGPVARPADAGMPDDHVVADVGAAAGLLHGTVDDVADQPGRLAECQRRGQGALALPPLAALGHTAVSDRARPARRGVTSSRVQKNTSSASGR